MSGRLRLICALAVAVLAPALMDACADEERRSTPDAVLCPELARSSDAAREPAFMSVDREGRLTRFELPGGRAAETRRVSLGPLPPQGLGGRILTAWGGGDGVALLEQAESPAREHVAILDSGTLEARCRFRLPLKTRYRAIAGAGERLYAFGNRLAAGGRSAAVISVLAPNAEKWQSHVVRSASEDWYVQWGEVSAQGDEAIVSYHGAGTTGADIVDLEAEGKMRLAYFGEVHGSAESLAEGFLATSGSDLIELGGRTEPLSADAMGVHLMHFASDGERAYVSACGDRPSVNEVDLGSGSLRRVPTGEFCGEALAVEGNRLALAATKVSEDGFPSSLSYRLRLIDLDGGGPGEPLGESSVLAAIAVPGSGD